MELRAYQSELLDRVVDELSGSPNARVMLQLPTGGGKTRIAGQLLSRFLSGGRKAVWLTHRRELAAQTEGMLQEDGVSATKDISWEPGSVAPPIPNGVVILMAQTVARRTARADVWGRYDANDLMIIDEAHHATAEGWTRAIRQWPGPVLGMTATPWRLSKREGFDHLFADLVCGPQVASLQTGGWLCGVRVMSPPEGDLVLGGSVDATGDYSEPGIEEANRDRDVWTGGALRFWERHGEDRQTVVYAVSVRHAGNLADVFNNAGIPAGVLVADTPDAERSEIIEGFRTGRLRALINVAVATEGFDLPDAACILLTRPTMSLALYLQMVGRGMRPKLDSGDCVVLDLAGNSLIHGLPDNDREWSLMARGEQPLGDMPLIRCERCEALSAAGSHDCGNCGWQFGEECGRCGAWRAWKRWTRRSICDEDHDEVCDLCHYDAHLLANLPVTEELEELAKMRDDDELSPRRDPYLKNMLEEEQRRLGGTTEARKDEIRRSIEQRESNLADETGMKQRFTVYLDSLAELQRPASERQWWSMYFEWEDKYRAETDGLKGELARLEAQTVDGQLVLRNVREQLMRLLNTEALEAGLIVRAPIQSGALPASIRGTNVVEPGGELNFLQLDAWTRSSYSLDIKPRLLRDPFNNEIPVESWSGLLRETAECLIRQGLLDERSCPITSGVASNKYVIHTEPWHPGRRRFGSQQRLTNGLWLDTQQGGGDRIARICSLVTQTLGGDPARFQVQLTTASGAGAFARPQREVSAPLRSSVVELPASGNWVPFTQLAEFSRTLAHREASFRPQRLRSPRGDEVNVNKWVGLLRETAEWLIREGILTRDKCPVVVGSMQERCLINSEPVHPNGRWFRRVIELSDGFFAEGNLYSRDVARHIAPLVETLGEDPSQFSVQLSS